MSLTVSGSQPIPNKTDLSCPGIERLRSACLGVVILKIETLSPGEGRLFTPREYNKSLRMGPRRLKSYTASRIALKDLCRQLGLAEKTRSDRDIETLGPDDLRPCLAESRLYCSVSHSSRFVVAVAHDHPVGVDIEGVSNKVRRIQRLFLSQAERQLLSRSGLDFEPAATLIWSMKEAAAKALELPLFQALHEVEVVRIERETALIRVNGKTYPARHSQGDDQVIALVTCNDL